MELLGRILTRHVNLAPCRSYHRCIAGSLLPLSQPSATPFTKGDDRTINGTTALSLGGVRTDIQQYNDKVAKRVAADSGGIDYYGFSYFPRPGEVDPPYEPTKLFMVRRIDKIYTRPWWDRKYLYKLGLFSNIRDRLSRRSDVVLIKNTPENCKMLHRVKHLIEIVPVTFPKGFPKDATSGFLKENGEFETYSDIGEARAKNVEQETKALDKVLDKHLSQATIKKRLHRKWFSRFDANV